MLMHTDDREATLAYGPNAFRVMRPGSFVTCAVTGEPIPLEVLRYWSVEHQEPYASPLVASQRMLGEA